MTFTTEQILRELLRVKIDPLPQHYGILALIITVKTQNLGISSFFFNMGFLIHQQNGNSHIRKVYNDPQTHMPQ